MQNYYLTCVVSIEDPQGDGGQDAKLWPHLCVSIEDPQGDDGKDANYNTSPVL
jgi:hypothetical protein